MALSAKIKEGARVASLDSLDVNVSFILAHSLEPD
jgi:hypothetical protein